MWGGGGGREEHDECGVENDENGNVRWKQGVEI